MDGIFQEDYARFFVAFFAVFFAAAFFFFIRLFLFFYLGKQCSTNDIAMNPCGSFITSIFLHMQ